LIFNDLRKTTLWLKEDGKVARSVTAGVLALQGGFQKHIDMVLRLGAKAIEVRKPKDLDLCDALIIPGGESTVIWRQLHFIQMQNPLKEFAKDKPVFGTCAGLILMASHIISDSMTPFGWIDASIERNAFGRQADSFQTDVNLDFNRKHSRFPAVFIRAPRIRQVGSQVNVLALYDEEPILVQQGHHLGATFHPELTADTSIHEYFLQLA
jgi:5'-phosphate synthase pdxT subunit